MLYERDLTIVRWVGRLGVATAPDVAERFGLGDRAALARLGAGVRAGLLARRRVLADQPALYLATRAGLRATGLDRLATCRVSAASFTHARACARVAVALEREPPGRVMSDRELRAAERACGRRLASAELGIGRDGSPRSHHPDLVLWPGGEGSPGVEAWPDGEGRPDGERWPDVEAARPLAVEVELTVKSPARLRAICRAWARNRRICGVVYYASRPAERALRRAIAAMYAEEFVEVLALDPMLDPAASGPATIPSQATRSVASGESIHDEGGFAPDGIHQHQPRHDHRQPHA
jgi:hypothetical protein